MLYSRLALYILTIFCISVSFLFQSAQCCTVPKYIACEGKQTWAHVSIALLASLRGPWMGSSASVHWLRYGCNTTYHASGSRLRYFE